jgi:hypothetical protein
MRCGFCKSDGPEVTVNHVMSCARASGIEPGGQGPAQSSRDRHHDDRRATIDMVNELGLKVEPGRYAIHNGPKADNGISFYKVDRPDEGRWAGKTFVKQLLSDNETRLSVARAYAVLTALAADPQGAMLLYGQKIGQCGHCGRTLTNEDSRARGIGPICAKNMGWNDAA